MGKNQYATSVHAPGMPRLLHDKYDPLFKEIVGSSWCVRSSGNVEAPSGFFSVTEIPDNVHELDDMRDALIERLEGTFDDLAAWPAPGWYVTVENSDGIIFVYEVRDEVEANFQFANLEDQFDVWSDAGNLP